MIDKIINTLINKQDEIVDTLLQIEDKEVALEEIRLSHNALMNIKNYDTKANINSTYLPMNLPLYSLIIYVVIPKLCSNKSYYRPSTKTLKQSIQVHEILELDKYNIKLIDNNRKYFYDNYVTKSNVVIFVGKTENAIEVSKKLSKDIMFIYFGVGQNPIVVEKDANIDLASKKIVDAVMFNSGQDCAKPNAILVNKEIYKQLKLNILKYIQYKLKNNGCIQDVNVLYDVSKFLIEENNLLFFANKLNYETQDNKKYNYMLNKLNDGFLIK